MATNMTAPTPVPMAAPKNKMAIASIICGLGGWIVNFLLICFNLTIGLAFAVVTFGLGYLCLLPLAVISPAMWIAGAITGHIGLDQIKRTGESGRELAITGLVSSYIGLGLGILVIIAIGILAVSGVGLAWLATLVPWNR